MTDGGGGDDRGDEGGGTRTVALSRCASVECLCGRRPMSRRRRQSAASEAPRLRARLRVVGQSRRAKAPRACVRA